MGRTANPSQPPDKQRVNTSRDQDSRQYGTKSEEHEMKTESDVGAQRNVALRICRDLLMRLKRKVSVVRIYAYGSRIRGDSSPDSDLDLVVELSNPSPGDKHAVHDAAWEIGLEEGILISAIVVSEEVFEHGRLSHSPFACNVKREGIEVAA